MSYTPAQVAKAFSGALAAGLAAWVSLATTAHQVTASGWVSVAVSAVVAFLAVFVTPNSPVANVLSAVGKDAAAVEKKVVSVTGGGDLVSEVKQALDKDVPK